MAESVKSIFKPNHIQDNKGTLTIPDLGIALTVNMIGEMDEELEAPELPDGTRSSAGRVKAFEFAIEIPMHHEDEIEAMDNWWADCRDPVAPDHKKIGIRRYLSNTNLVEISETLLGLFIIGRSSPQMQKSNEGGMQFRTYTFSCDQKID